MSHPMFLAGFFPNPGYSSFATDIIALVFLAEEREAVKGSQLLQAAPDTLWWHFVLRPNANPCKSPGQCLIFSRGEESLRGLPYVTLHLRVTVHSVFSQFRLLHL